MKNQFKHLADSMKRAEIQKNGWLVSPSSLDSDAVMILDKDARFLELYYPRTRQARCDLIEEFHWIEKRK
ncbi:hypothetical protein [Vibrio harveyi]|uniref:hypothetical protein n=1 Tax=Vibrio harveyi TaxID=669 RepID=UPI00237DABD1|nr:hypothetical protein [Vibrio harveyi]HDM8061680.1 hypothetical protein [Vibrio harveyi]